jgi:hypothetical protein
MRRGFVFVASGLFFCILSNINAAVTVYVVPPVSNWKILPNDVLPDMFISRELVLTACRGEFEPASFVVRSDTDITGLCLTSSDLILEDGTGIIPADYVDIRVVKCWYQAGYRVNDLIHKHLTPELIVKDDSLIYTSDESNYLKLTPNGGSPYYICISTPDTRTDRQVLSLTEFPVRDTDDLQPVNLVSGQNKQFWITVKVPEDAAFGTYTGHITLTTSDIVETIDVKIWVPEFTLLPPCLTYSIYYRGVLDPIGSISSERKSVAQFTAEMRNLFNHGVTMPTLYGQNYYLRDALSIRQNEHIDNSTLYYLGYGISRTDLASLWPGFIDTITPYGVNHVYIYGYDEQDHNTTQRRAQIATVHALGGKVFVAQKSTMAVSVADILDLAVVSGSPQTSLVEMYHANGNKIFSYGNPQVGEENPATYRYNYGILLWLNGYDGAMPYAYQDSFGNIWNDFDHYRYRDHNFTYPTVNGVIDTLAWEGFREGVDDVRYLTTLSSQIDEVMQGADPRLKRIAKNCQAWLFGHVPSGSLDPDQIRAKVTEYIRRLKGLPERKPVKYPYLRGKWSFDELNRSIYAYDESSYENVGTLINMDVDTVWVDGQMGGALSLNNGTTGQYVDCGNAESLNISEEITVTAWVKPTAPQSQVIYIRGQNGSRVRLGVNPMISLWVNTENEGWHNGGEGNTHDWTGWHHIAWTYHRATNTTKFYFDGVEDFCSTTISTGPLTSEPLQYVRIGGGENNRYFHGDLDEVRIYAKALSSDAIKAIFNGTDLPPDDRLAGDANGDGKVDVGDLGILAANYGGAGKTWSQGDFNGDGVVDVGDLGILAANYGTATNNADFHSDYMQVFGPYATDIDSDVEDNNIPCSGVGFFLIVGALFFYWLKPENLDRFGV